MHPLLRMHHQCVEKRVTEGEAAAAELGLELEADTIRAALAYERGEFHRMALKVALDPLWQINILMLLLLSTLWVQGASQGETMPRCSKPIYPLLNVLTFTQPSHVPVPGTRRPSSSASRSPTSDCRYGRSPPCGTQRARDLPR